jgi:hypothetical protein
LERIHYLPSPIEGHVQVEGETRIVVGLHSFTKHHVEQMSMLTKNHKVVGAVEIPNDWFHGA